MCLDSESLSHYPAHIFSACIWSSCKGLTMSQNYNAADLHSILKTLSTFSGQTTSTPHQSALNAHDPSGNNGYNDPENDYEPPDAFPSPITHPQAPTHQTSTHSPLTSSSTSHLHQHPTNPPVSSSSTPQAKDSTPPSEITTWPAALKRVMHTVAQNEEIQRRIRVLIQRQHDHEKQWWQGREALLQKQKSRAEKKRELDRVLRSVGAPVDGKEVSVRHILLCIF
ncbi:uncharacterized protein BJX67DRAFT_354837 [Aspergillus lucknowensis]|uniref:Uncharacterized protein n=1 Tax=Aspergillus lucknowensis TaxID=176173 RepID=A0ABR4LQG3_9EURO